MNPLERMILALGLVGMAMSAVSIVLYPMAIIGSLIAWLPAILLLMRIRGSPAIHFIQPQGANESLVFFITAGRKMWILPAYDSSERYLKFKNHYGRLRVSSASDLSCYGRKVYIARQGVAHTIPLDKAETASALRAAGFKNLAEVKEAYEIWRKAKALETARSLEGGESEVIRED
ncbi:MAG: hypothetical protein DRG33_05330 [Deltaproteobacteria bacterium]|nr:MAG: hypothetical protein DRG33_05330 [Deltaproteobacteria bacterium]